MNGAPTETSRIIIRMRLADRQAISTMMQHKRSEFEYHLTRGVISMLNAKAQHLKLSEKRKEYLKILDEKSKRNKDRLNSLSNQVIGTK
jgi:transcriptional antiterminator Rof (Rho-off)